MAWYQESFGNDYLIVYKHRDLQGAYNEVKQMIDWLQLPVGAEVLDLCCGMGRHA
jgi:ubiquinone/menaquinone biosynthesis C-methylase UbiE